MSAFAWPQDDAAGGKLAALAEHGLSLFISVAFHGCIVVLTLFIGIVISAPKPQDVLEADSPPALSLDLSGTGKKLEVAQGGAMGRDNELKLTGPGLVRNLGGGVPGQAGGGERAPELIGVKGAGGDVGPARLIGGVGEGQTDGKDKELKLPPGPIRGTLTDNWRPAPIGQTGVSRIVYLLDASGSMHDDFDIVRGKLIGELGKLEFDEKTGRGQYFNIIFFRQKAEPFSASLLPATVANRLAGANWLRGIRPSSQTDPVPALQLAFKLRPQYVVVLSDGEFERKVLEVVTDLQKTLPQRAKVIAIGYGQFACDNLEKLARDNDGFFIRIDPEE